MLGKLVLRVLPLTWGQYTRQHLKACSMYSINLGGSAFLHSYFAQPVLGTLAPHNLRQAAPTHLVTQGPLQASNAYPNHA